MDVTTNFSTKKFNTGFWDTCGHGKTPVSVSIKCSNLIDKQTDYYLPKNE